MDDFKVEVVELPLSIYQDKEMLKFWASVLQKLYPSYTYCARCGIPWNHCNAKSVRISPHRGTFATCDRCWNESTLHELKYYYTSVHKEQYKGVPSDKIYSLESLEHLLSCVEKEYYKKQQDELGEMKVKKHKVLNEIYKLWESTIIDDRILITFDDFKRIINTMYDTIINNK